jgi:hypothetical protein
VPPWPFQRCAPVPRTFRVPPLREGICRAESLKPWAAFPMWTALPSSEYYAVRRLLPARLPPFGLAYRVRHTLSRRREVSHVPIARISAMPRSQTPPRFPPLAMSGLRYCLPANQDRRPSVYRLTRLNPAAWTSRCLRFAVDPRGGTTQDSLRRGWLVLRRPEFHRLCAMSYRGARWVDGDLDGGSHSTVPWVSRFRGSVLGEPA